LGRLFCFDIHEVEQILKILALVGCFVFKIQVHFFEHKLFLLREFRRSFLRISSNLCLGFRRSTVLKHHMVVVVTFVHACDLS